MSETGDLRQELEAIKDRYDRLAAETEAFRKDAADTVRELSRVIERQQEALQGAMETSAMVAAIRASNVGRAAAIVERARLRARRLRMAAAGRWARLRGARRVRVPQAVKEKPIGVNVAGYINAESGLGEATRCSIRALQRAGLPLALNNIPGPQRMADTTFTAFTTDNPHPFNLVHLNADNMDWFRRRQGRHYFRDRYTIGYWFWELEAFRDDWLPAFRDVDEVWVAAEYTRASIGRHSPVPVLRMPLGLPEPVIARLGRSHFGIPEHAFVFLYMFDVSSQMERKNPFGAIRAFRLADLKYDDAVLFLKFTNGHTDRAAVRRLVDASAGLNVIMLDGALHRPELNALMACTDCALSLHRAEGFGMTIAEHMAMGKPAIATAYSANLEFMTPDVSRLVPARRVTIARDYGPYLRGLTWADPDLDQAAAAIRELVRTPGLARQLGHSGQQYVRRVLDPARTAALMRGRLERVRAGQLDAEPAADPIEVHAS